MNKLEKLKLLIQSPIKVIKNGLLGLEEGDFKQKCAQQYKISALPTVDWLDMMPVSEINIRPYSFLHGTSLITDLALLKGLASKYKDCAYLEIGSWRGESISNVSDVTNDCTAITLSEKEMNAFGFGQDFIDAHGFFTAKNKKIKYYKHNSQTFDFTSLNKKFDLIFIDGDHSYEGVLKDTINVFKHCLKNEDSMIVWHDYGNDTENVRYSVLKAILDGIPASKHQNLYHVSNTLCAIYSEKPLKVNKNVKRFYPNKVFNVAISAKLY